jgi:hypothetical protein
MVQIATAPIVTLIFSLMAAKIAVADSLMARSATSSALVDPVTQPECLFSNCWHWNSPPPEICPLVSGPCPNNSQASDNGGSKCGHWQYEKDCYCNLKAGLSCAWSCSWTNWWLTEDWFARVCPDSPALKLDFSGLPKCARECLDDASFNYGCLTQTSNCFCSHGDLFGCQDHCHTDQEWRQISQWLQGACGIGAAKANSALQQGYFYLSSEPAVSVVREKGPPPPVSKKPLTWGEKFILAVVSLTVVVGLGIWIFHCTASRKLKRPKKHQRDSAIRRRV